VQRWTNQWILTLSTVALLGCGEFDNATIRSHLQDSQADLSCGQRMPVALSHPVLPPLTEGQPWAGWLHAQAPQGGTLRWEVGGLPGGVLLAPNTGMLMGTPHESGLFTLNVTVHVDGCPEAMDSQTWEIEVEPKCMEDCDIPDACGVVQRDTLIAYVVGVKAGNRVARNGLKVLSAALPRAVGSDTTHRMVLSDPTSLSKDQVVIHYTLPGGVLPPIQKDEEVDLRFIHGEHGDQYLFLTEEREKPKGRRTKLAVYNGHLSADELIKQCPDSGQDTHCHITDFHIGPSSCHGWSSCGSTDLLSVEVTTMPPRSTSPGWTSTRLMPGQAGELRNHELMRLADATTVPWDDACGTNLDVPYRLSFYIVPVWFCPFAEIHRVDNNDAQTAPTGAVFTGRVLYPTQYAHAVYHWSIEGPSAVAHTPLAQDQAGHFWTELPLAGNYSVFLTTDLSLDGGQPMHACDGHLAVNRFQIPPPEGHRVELSWTPITPGGGGIQGSEPMLWVGSDHAGVPQAPMVQAVDLPAMTQSEPILVDYPPSSGMVVRAEVRIWANGRLVFTAEQTLTPGDQWDVGLLQPDGLDRLPGTDIR
jgi:hypothetical protein